MKICFSCNLEKYKPKGNVLQFLGMLKAFDREVSKLSNKKRKKFVIDCVLPFEFQNGHDGFKFHHVRFHQADDLTDKIIKQDEKKDYDFIFIRGRDQALDLVKKKRSLGDKLLFLSINYNLNDPRIMKEVHFLLRHTRVIFFQSVPIAERFKAYLRRKKWGEARIERQIKVLPQFVEAMSEEKMLRIHRATPPQLINCGVIRPRYGLPVAVKAIRLIRKRVPEAKLNLLYPSIVNAYRPTAEKLLKKPGVVNHGQKNVWETKKMIVKAGIGLALIYDNTPDLTPSHAYLSRVLEYMALGVPVLTTRTFGNVHLLGDNYPLFVQDEHDIARCYHMLNEPAYYQEMSEYVRERGKAYLGENAIKDFWKVLTTELGMPA
ncbi:glycosyltransferase family 1 protein [Brevibacillus fluminis]|uniref:glycosyltransferase family 1 protein n=1 Tax=Brevibacillus fluminis TaxID=511487 RepID=UPI003F8B1722